MGGGNYRSVGGESGSVLLIVAASMVVLLGICAICTWLARRPSGLLMRRLSPGRKLLLLQAARPAGVRQAAHRRVQAGSRRRRPAHRTLLPDSPPAFRTETSHSVTQTLSNLKSQSSPGPQCPRFLPGFLAL